MRSKIVIKNITSMLILQAVTLICGFIVPRYIIESYGSNVNGLVTSISKFLAYISLLELGFGPVVKSILYKPIANKNKSEIESILKTSEKFFRNIAYIFILYIIVLCIIMQAIVSNEYNYVYTFTLVLIISISIFAEYYFGMTYRLYLQAEQKNYVISIIQISTLIINAVLTVILIKMGFGIHLVKLVTALIFIARPILQNIYVKRRYNLNLRKVQAGYDIKQKWDGLAQHIAYVVHQNTDIIILTLFSTMSEVSVYYVYLMVVSGMKNILQSLINGIDGTFGDMIAREEKDNLNKSFKVYEFIYFTILTIICTATLFLIIPFVSVYTKGITDANYIRPIFAYLIVIAEFIWGMRLPYSSITNAAGHFKETKNGAWVETFVNIFISMLLVWKLGLVGVAIGTLVAMLIRTIEFMYHASKYILCRKILYTFKYVVVIILEVICITILVNILPSTQITNYLEWVVQAIKTTSISTIVVLGINGIVFFKETKEIVIMLKEKIKGVKKN